MKIFAPIPGSSAKNSSRYVYDAFLAENRKVAGQLQAPTSLLEFLRRFNIDFVAAEDPSERPTIIVKRRVDILKVRGANKKRCALAIRFPFELLDIYVGVWCAVMVPHRRQEQVLIDNFVNDPSAPDGRRFQWDQGIPEGARFTAAALRPDHYANVVQKLIDEISIALKLRGLGANRIRTFQFRIQPIKKMLEATTRSDISAIEWTARS